MMSPDDGQAIEQPLERLPIGGPRRPIGIASAIVLILALLVWQPWGKGPAAGQASPAAPDLATAIAVAPNSRPSPSDEPATTPRSGGSDGPTAEPYVSLVDNEWTVVALLAPDVPPSTEEPSIQHGAGATSGSPALFVLQQGLNYTVAPLVGAGQLELACAAPYGSRLRTAVQLPPGRVEYLGVTFPGMDPKARVTATAVDRPSVNLKRVAPLVVPLSGMTEGRRYTVPSSGMGGAVLFATTPPQALVSAIYRFDVDAPGIEGTRHLYACVGP